MIKKRGFKNIWLINESGIKEYLFINTGSFNTDQSIYKAECELANAIYKLSSKLLENTAIRSYPLIS